MWICYVLGHGGCKKWNQGAEYDQKLKKGNLALAKSWEHKMPVRVIRGHQSNTRAFGPGFLGYSYDGLYTVESFELTQGPNGYKVYKYTMMRLENQPPIAPCMAGCTSHRWNTVLEPPTSSAPDARTSCGDVATTSTSTRAEGGASNGGEAGASNGGEAGTSNRGDGGGTGTSNGGDGGEAGTSSAEEAGTSVHLEWRGASSASQV